MFTVLSNTRNSALYVIGAVAIVLLGLLLQPMLPVINVSRPALIPVTGSQDAQALFRQEELALYNRPAASSIGSPSFMEYRRGEWSTGGMSAAEALRHEELMLYSRKSVDSISAYRQEELSIYNRPASSIGSPSFFEYRRGEWSGD